VTYVSTAFINITVGLVVGIALAVLLAMVQTQRANGGRLTRAADTEIYYHPTAKSTTSTTFSTTIPAGIVVFRSDLLRARYEISVGLHVSAVAYDLTELKQGALSPTKSTRHP